MPEKHFLLISFNDSLFYTLEAFTYLWEKTVDKYKEAAYEQLQYVLIYWKDRSIIAAENYIDVLYNRQSIRGTRRKKLDKIIQPLHEKWPESIIINKLYIENLGELGKNQFLNGSEKGKNNGLKIARILQKQYENTKNKEIVEACIIAIGKLLTATYQDEGVSELFRNELLNSLFSNINNSNNAINLIEACSSIVLAQYESHPDSLEWKTTLNLLTRIINNQEKRSFDYDWRLADVLLSIIRVLIHGKDSEAEAYQLINIVCKLAKDSLKVDNTRNVHGGSSWHWRRIINRIQELNITESSINQKLSDMHELLLQK